MTGNGWQLPDDAVPPACTCDARRETRNAVAEAQWPWPVYEDGL